MNDHQSVTRCYHFNGISPVDAEQIALPYELAKKKLEAFSDAEKTENLKRFERNIDACVNKIPKRVMKTIKSIHPQAGQIDISPGGPVAITNGGHMSPGAALFDHEGNYLNMELSLPLLFSPKEVFGQVVAHEYAHVYLRALGRKFTGKNVPWDCAFRNEYLDNLPLLEEEVAVDECTVAWGFGDRNVYLLWEAAVWTTKSLDCDEVFQALHKGLNPHS